MFLPLRAHHPPSFGLTELSFVYSNDPHYGTTSRYPSQQVSHTPTDSFLMLLDADAGSVGFGIRGFYWGEAFKYQKSDGHVYVMASLSKYGSIQMIYLGSGR